MTTRAGECRREVVDAFVAFKTYPYLDDEYDRLSAHANALAGDGLSQAEYDAIVLGERQHARRRA